MLNFSQYNLSEAATKAKIRASVAGVGRKTSSRSRTSAPASSGGTASVKPLRLGKKPMLIPLTKPVVKSDAKLSTGRYPWLSTTMGQAGWWHPTGKFLTFIWKFERPRGSFHVTQVFNNPQVFGYTDEELRKGFCRDEHEYNEFKTGVLDWNTGLMDSVEKRGWLRIHHSDAVFIAGGLKSSFIKALQDAMLSIPPSKDGSVSFEVPETLNDPKGAGTKKLGSIEDIENYLSRNK